MGLEDLFIPMTKGNINHGSITEKISIMSRSRKKAIIKDRGARKNDYWRTYRRVNKQITKHFIDSAREFVDCNYNEWDEFFKFKNFFIQEGMDPEEAHLEAYYHIEDDVIFDKISSDLYRLWWESPEYKLPKEVINDYDYCDFAIDYEYTLRYEYWFDHNKREWDTDKHEEMVKKLKRK